MAAILCKPISACLEFVCTAPCKICSGCCHLCSDGLSGICKNPLGAFVMITFLTQIPLAVAAALELGDLFNGCKGSRWLMGMLVVAILHMVTCVYLANRVTNRTDEALRDKHTSWQRISYLMCHDPWIALYILVVCFFIFWLIMGSTWTLNGDMDESSSCGSDLDDRVSIVLGLGWFYLFIGPSVLSCNLCCVCCDKTDYAADDAEFAAKEAEKEAKKQKRHSSARKSSAAGSNMEPDIESPYEQPYQPQEKVDTESKRAASSSRTYSVDGTPVPDDPNADVVEAEVVIEGDDLPPPMPPPKEIFSAQAAKAQEAAGNAVRTVNSKVGGWLNKKKNGGNGSNQPDTKATIY